VANIFAAQDRSQPLPNPLKYLFLKDLAGIKSKNNLQTLSNSLIYKYFNDKSLFLKDLAFFTR